MSVVKQAGFLIRFTDAILAEAREAFGEIIPGDMLASGEAREAHRKALGWKRSGKGYNVPSDHVRHVVTLGKRDAAAIGATSPMCPRLQAEGIAMTTLQADRERNTRELRAATLPCPYCLIPLFRRDAEAEAPGAGEYDAERHAIRNARGKLPAS